MEDEEFERVVAEIMDRAMAMPTDDSRRLLALDHLNKAQRARVLSEAELQRAAVSVDEPAASEEKMGLSISWS